MFSTLSKPVTNIFRLSSHKLNSLLRMSSNSALQTLSVSVPKEFVYHVKLNRPEKVNAVNQLMLSDLKKCFFELSEDENCRVIVLSGEGKLFTAGIDLTNFIGIASKVAQTEDVARKAKVFNKTIVDFQEAISSLELCRKPVLAAVHSACIGAGVDLITAADMRYCTKDAYFQIKEVDVGLAADVGTLQRLPKVIGSDSLARELCYTARKMHADEALNSGLVSRVFGDKDEMLNAVEGIAESIAKKSPVAVQSTKASLVFSRDHSVQEGLNHIALWNQMNLQSEDLTQSAMAQMTKDKNVVFSKL
ncbi:delta(3,5)-Delta(2,4)-dienoyl-CoA isomerase, mitochondrial isoform X1 [Leptinotarsa decemlineata]|uniref:delta(3,5)-Delta(2,4)-dienoyl-CoA isomerase, mitochondrial isoform X1 n=2 Tax=Leptinotarsa decemlineata TaxID=7539 RepID=UPI003D305F20